MKPGIVTCLLVGAVLGVVMTGVIYLATLVAAGIATTLAAFLL